jgi:hypothetical protein
MVRLLSLRIRLEGWMVRPSVVFSAALMAQPTIGTIIGTQTQAAQGRGCGNGDCLGTTGLRDRELKSGLPVGFDPAIWGQNPNINNGYPYLLANPPP